MQVGAGHLGIIDEIFSSICGIYFLGIPDEQFNLGHLSYSFQLRNMVTIDEVRNYLSSLNTIDIIWLGFRLGDQKAKLSRENSQPSEALLVVLDLIKEQIHNRFELIRIIQMAVPNTMAKIRK